MGAYSRPEAAIVACGRQQGFLNQKSRLKSGNLVTLIHPYPIIDGFIIDRKVQIFKYFYNLLIGSFIIILMIIALNCIIPMSCLKFYV